jgi:hypothetical protein
MEGVIDGLNNSINAQKKYNQGLIVILSFPFDSKAIFWQWKFIGVDVTVMHH